MKPRALCFDLDRTLLDTSGNAEALRLTCDVVAAAAGLDAGAVLAANASAWSAYFPQVEHAWVTGRIETATIGLEAWRRTLAACDCNDEGLVALARDTHDRLVREGYRLYDDVLPCLEALPADVGLAVITNGASGLQREKLRLLGIDARFDAVVVSGEQGAAKPDARVFELACEGLGVPPESAWHVGDSLQADVRGARAAGLTAVWLNREGTPRRPSDPTPDHEIWSLAELPSLITEQSR